MSSVTSKEITTDIPTDNAMPALTPASTPPLQGIRFWLLFAALGVSLFLSPLELTSVSTALPTIVEDLGGGNFIWVTSAYTLSSTAVLPMSGKLAQIFGRRYCMLAALAFFALGSALCGSSQNMSWLIAGRAIQGVGGGMILSIVNIIISDLIPLKERGTFSGVLGLAWAVAAAIGPLIGGALASSNEWRWLFYLNLPIAGVAFASVFWLLDIPTPTESLREKLLRIDWIGNMLIISSTSAVIIALTWGGVRYSWSSAHIIAPLVLGLLGMIGFGFYEKWFAREPIMPITLIMNRTSISGYLQTFINHLVTLAVIYYLPVYFQACKGASAVRSGIDSLGLSVTLGPVVILCGISVTILNGYRLQSWIGWVVLIIGLSLLSTVHSDTVLAKSIAYSALVSIGSGMVSSLTYFPVQAPLAVDEAAPALGFLVFCRAFASVWGVSIGGVILQNELIGRLPLRFLNLLPGGSVDIAYSAIFLIKTLDDQTSSQVLNAFGDSVSIIWIVMASVAGLGFLSSLLMKAIPMHTEVADQGKGISRDEKVAVIGDSALEKGEE